MNVEALLRMGNKDLTENEIREKLSRILNIHLPPLPAEEPVLEPEEDISDSAYFDDADLPTLRRAMETVNATIPGYRSIQSQKDEDDSAYNRKYISRGTPLPTSLRGLIRDKERHVKKETTPAPISKRLNRNAAPKTVLANGRPIVADRPAQSSDPQVKKVFRQKAAVGRAHDRLVNVIGKAGTSLIEVSKSFTTHQVNTSLIAAGGLALGAYSLISQPEPVTPSAEQKPVVSQNDFIRAAPKGKYCSEKSPLYVDGPVIRKFTTDAACKRLLQAVPAPSSEFTTYSKNTAVRALANGNFEFRFVKFKDDKDDIAKWLSYPDGQSIFGDNEVRGIYLNAYKSDLTISDKVAQLDMEDADIFVSLLKREARGQTIDPELKKRAFTHGAERILSHREHNSIDSIVKAPVTAKNYQGIVSSWMTSGGHDQEPLPFSFLLSKWYLESRLGAGVRSNLSTACGINQNLIGTFLDEAKNYAHALGFEDLGDKVKRVSERNGNNDRRTIHDPGYRYIFNTNCENVFYSGSLGLQNTAHILLRLENDVKKGRVHLPDGRTRIGSQDGYVVHFLAGNYSAIYQGLERNPHTKVIDLFPQNAKAYDKNWYMFESRKYRTRLNGNHRTEYVVDKNGNKIIASRAYFSVGEFYNNLTSRYGFDSRPLYPKIWDAKDTVRPGTIDFSNAVKGLNTEFRLAANEGADPVLIQMRPNAPWLVQQMHDKEIVALEHKEANASPMIK